MNSFPFFNNILESALIPEYVPGIFRIVPEALFESYFLKFLDAFFLVLYVKGNL
jgi:hypothetical protein